MLSDGSITNSDEPEVFRCTLFKAYTGGKSGFALEPTDKSADMKTFILQKQAKKSVSAGL